MQNQPASNLEYILSALRHEIMNPLSRIALHLELLGENESNKEIKKDINNMLGEIVSIINNSIDLYTVVEPIRVKSLLSEIIVSDYPGANLSEIKEDLFVTSSKGGIRQILHNLLSNASKYNSSGNCILEVVEDGAWVRIKVKDDGEEIPIDYSKLIFERGYRLERDYNKFGEGIGLHVSRGLAERLKGGLHYYRESGYNTFELFLPVE